VEIRNIAIIAHVDHGKTTLTDALLRQTGVGEEGVSMDSNDARARARHHHLRQKRLGPLQRHQDKYRRHPGHADFGSEVERVLRSIDSVLLVVDAQEGPMPQTRFVLKKSLELGLKPIVVINKIDKPAADPARCEEQVLELFLSLAQTTSKATSRLSTRSAARASPSASSTDESKDLTPLLDMILSTSRLIAREYDSTTLLMQPFNLGYDNFLGRLAFVRIYEGKAQSRATRFCKKPDRRDRARNKITKFLALKGLQRIEIPRLLPATSCSSPALGDIYIGETVCEREQPSRCPLLLSMSRLLRSTSWLTARRLPAARASLSPRARSASGLSASLRSTSGSKSSSTKATP
jgi:GTP-binding protein